VGGNVERCEAVLALDVGLGLSLQEEAGHFDIAVFGGDVQWRETF